jgi:hypothetical protein
MVSLCARKHDVASLCARKEWGGFGVRRCFLVLGEGRMGFVVCYGRVRSFCCGLVEGWRVFLRC